MWVWGYKDGPPGLSELLFGEFFEFRGVYGLKMSVKRRPTGLQEGRLKSEYRY